MRQNKVSCLYVFFETSISNNLEERHHTAGLVGHLLGEHLKVLVDDSDGKEDSGSGSDGTHEIGDDGESTDAHTSEGGSDGDVVVEDLDGRLSTVSGDDHLLVGELLGNLLGGRAGNLNPDGGEEGASNQDEGNVEDGVDGVIEDLGERSGGRDVVGESTNGDRAGTGTGLNILPLSEERDNKVGRVTTVEELGEEVEVGHEGGLENDGDVRGIEELDGVRSVLSSVAGVLDREIDAEALEVDNNQEHEDGGHEVGTVGEVLSVEGFLEGADLVATGDEQVEESNEGTFELGTTAGVDRGGGEGLPDDVLANVRGDEEGNTRSKTVTLLEELIKKNDNDSGEEELKDEEDGVTGSERTNITVHTREDVGDGLTEGDHQTEKLLGSLEQGAILLHRLVNMNDVGSSEKLHNKSRRHNWGNTKLHEGTTVRGNDDTEPVEGIRRGGVVDSVEGNLTTDKEDEEGDDGPHDLQFERDLALRCADLGQHDHERPNQMKETHCKA